MFAAYVIVTHPGHRRQRLLGLAAGVDAHAASTSLAAAPAWHMKCLASRNR
jgi:hypothetical protein